jgi:hypothetical protein
LNTLPSKIVAIPYTFGLSRTFSGAVAGEHSNICEVTWNLYLFSTMKNLKDDRTKIFPSTTRTGKELPSNSALDSPSILSKLATPPPAMNDATSAMSHVIDDTTSALNDAIDDASTMLDTTVPLGDFLDEQLAKVREFEKAKSAETLEDLDSPLLLCPIVRAEIPDEHFLDKESALAILNCNTREEALAVIAEIKEKSLRERMRCDPKFATSPIFITDEDYEFSIDPELITLVESDPFYGIESGTVVAHLTKLNDIATLFTHEEKICYYYILKLFPFSLKEDAKAWYNTLTPGCVRSPWYVSNVSIIFDCSMLLYYLFWMFYMLFYIIFGTNLLT